MAEKKFSELTAAAILGNDDIFALSQMDSGSLTSKKTTLTAIANHINTVVQYTNAYGTQAKTTAGAINELKQLISLIPQFSIEVVEELPTEDISDTTIYLVPAEDPEVGNYYEEYIHVNDTWELVGTTAVDLSAYYTKLEVDGLLADKLEADDFEANQTASANPITLETKQAGLAKSCVVTMNPIQSGSGDPSPTNIRPITGRTEASVVRTGKNLVKTVDWSGNQYKCQGYGGNGGSPKLSFDGKLKSGTYTLSLLFKNLGNVAEGSKQGLFRLWVVKDNTVYSFNTSTGELSPATTGGTFIFEYNANLPSDNTRISSYPFKIAEDIDEIRMGFYQSGKYVEIDEIQIELGSSGSAYEPYQGETHTKEFGQTVYGGGLDLTSGELVVDRIELDLGSLTWSVSTGHRFQANLPNNAYAKASGSYSTKSGEICENYPTLTQNDLFADKMGISLQGAGGNAGKIIFIYDENYSDATVLKSDLNGVKLVYYSVEETTIQLSPEAVTLLKGLNVISTDGDKVQVEFSDIPVGDYSALLDYVKSLEERIEALEG